MVDDAMNAGSGAALLTVGASCVHVPALISRPERLVDSTTENRDGIQPWRSRSVGMGDPASVLLVDGR